MAANSRAVAAGVIAGVLAGRSLDALLASAQEQIAERERPLLAQLCYGTLRLAPRLEALAGKLLDRPLRRKDQDVHALLLLGLYQLDATRIPDHAAVAETVAATATLGKPWARGLLNAVLRRYRREQAALEATLPPAAAAAHPAWFFRALAAEWPQALERIVSANNSQPPLTLRVNRQRSNRAAVLAALAGAGIEARTGTLSADAITLSRPCPVEALPGFAAGLLSVQDEAAQLAAQLLAPRDGERVLDACAAPGGKACHLLEIAPGCALTALDVDRHRLRRVEENLNRLGLAARCLTGDAADPALLAGEEPFQRILVDAPCSGSGVVRRHPDIKVLRRDDDADRLATRQRAILESCWARLAPGGRLLYVTCSIFGAENDAVVEALLKAGSDAGECTLAIAGAERTAHGYQLLPDADGTDGLYYALLEKAS
ncbi:16S rRNA (cytosine(967)-C(5))-methyltransferase RsmB [Pseudohaliea rubra]|uniref:16S rRNA (cytosine(967)-C(5))-methyltransferase n=1 Tax=Pseudohaliea rubra DSM 19751 TaxID=1265313 RepID=A0A095VSS1_9GAMM|nr:16S rRNA (cytosine(967)-C(5))-methyltransferase RsmB [Pseudohaliea rubra]KGE04420.1 Ribosomal RNA small subunit methyltransferase B [Pseudohaliea rubra DSM 19751]